MVLGPRPRGSSRSFSTSFVARGARFHALREVAWILAASQLIAVIVPVLWEVAKFFAIVILVVMAALLLVMLLMDRR